MSTSNSPKRKFSGIRTVTLLVGHDENPFFVHRDQLCQASSFFKAAFTSDFNESSEEVVNLPDDDIDTIDKFIQWLYSGQCETMKNPAGSSSDDIGECYMEPMKLLVFADKYDIPDFKKRVLRDLLAVANEEELGWLPPKSVVTFAYQNTCRGSGTRKLFVDWYFCYVETPWYGDNRTRDWLLEVLEFAIDLLPVLAQLPRKIYAKYPIEKADPEPENRIDP